MAAKTLYNPILFFLRVLLRRLTYTVYSPHRKTTTTTHIINPSKQQKHPWKEKLVNRTVVFDVEAALLRSSSSENNTFFHYFMVVALEGGGFMRGLVLLLLYPLVCCLNEEVGLKVMVMVSFFGLRREGFRVGRSVLPKHLMEDVGLEGFEMLRKGKRRVGVSCLPEVMVGAFLREYMEVEVVVGRKLKVVGGFFVGLMEEEEMVDGGGGDGAVGVGSSGRSLPHHLLSLSKEIYLVSESEKKNWHPLPKERQPKPVIFHDGRIAFKPTPRATLFMFLWLPFGLFLALFRALVFLYLPYKLAVPLLGFSGMKARIKCELPPHATTTTTSGTTGQLFVCNHRTLLDPLYISAAVERPMTAVTYSLSRLSELMSPIRTIRLTRNRDEDGRRMEAMLRVGDLVVCPEGTTCREPFLLRFSPLFAELGGGDGDRGVVPFAIHSEVGMFYGTTASGLKCLDPLFYLMNPGPCYVGKALDRVPTAGRDRVEVANRVQRAIGEALGYQCTMLTRRDKYLTLAGNEGYV
ncbi:putative glycerol-3-phosphate acyltransferase 2 [Acorus gramineus]|uniref:Glycerol-3-phosphate acyltransferase 2 n=1 Tax=Acorus gramineus TaxID=55184 RepID=A0AAV9BPP6_ACOGR|nr:putative glycerol-3-phosphate acyltransferase 2 [Acorus gramineus]